MPSVQDRIWRERIAPGIVRRDAGICYICGHAGADTADHVFPRTEMTDAQKRTMMFDQANLKAVHHKPCAICSAMAELRGYGPIRCNPLRGAYSIERVRRLINERTGQCLDEGVAARPGEPEGRDW
jgi:hypothetical protein